MSNNDQIVRRQLSFYLGSTVESSLRYSEVQRFSLIFQIPQSIFNLQIDYLFFSF
jgi:hypothetical protein